MILLYTFLLIAPIFAELSYLLINLPNEAPSMGQYLKVQIIGLDPRNKQDPETRLSDRAYFTDLNSTW